MAPINDDISASTQALHIDEAFNVTTDVAPPLHVATTFRYPDDPDELVPAAERGVCPAIPEPFYARF
jgi:cystathionine beta-lyase